MPKRSDDSQLMLSLPEPLAKASPSPDCERDWLMRVATWRSDMLNLLANYGRAGWSGRMSPACYQAGRMRRSVLRLKNPATLSEKLDALEQSSAVQVMTLDQKSALETLRKLSRPTILTSSPRLLSSGVIPSHGQSLTLNTSTWRSGASVCSLSEVLETGPIPRRYFLTRKACQGILRRAEKRGRALPPALLAALTAAARADTPDDASSPCYRNVEQVTDTLDISSLAKQQMMPEKNRFAAVLVPQGSFFDGPTHSLRADSFDASEDGTGRGTPIIAFNWHSGGSKARLSARETHIDALGSTQTPAVAFQERGRAGGRSLESQSEVADTLTAGGGRRQEMNVANGMAVRRLTPLECERLQGFSESRKSVTIRVCGDQQNCRASADNRNPKSHLVAVEIHCEAGTINVTIPESGLSVSARIADENARTFLATPLANFAQAAVLIFSILDQITRSGKVESHPSSGHSLVQENGSYVVNVSGDEIADVAEDVEQGINKTLNYIRYTISEVGLNSQGCDLSIQTCCSYAIRAISSCIPAITKLGSSFDLHVTKISSYTDIEIRSKRAADGPRYHAIGNSMCVNVLRWIGERIAAVEAITEGSAA